MTYAEALGWLYDLAGRHFTPLAKASPADLSLERMRVLLARLGNPQLGRRAVHITGSKGKGSTAVMMAALLQQSGARVGLFTSPHLHHETERYRVNGEPVAEADLRRLIETVRPVVDELDAAGEHGRLNTFDVRTALAFLHFQERGVEWQVLEVGIGGRLDSTNVVDDKDLCIFTPISLEHTQVLGKTVAEIATDKAGILRPGVPAVMGLQRESAAEVLRERAAELGAPLVEVAQACKMAAGKADLDGQEMRLRTPAAEYRVHLPLLGRHQLENAATALLGAEQLAGAGVALTPAQAGQALAGVRWPGRLEVLKRSPLVVVDGAHNGDSARRLVQALRSLFSYRRLLIIAGLNADKQLDDFAREFASLEGEVLATRSAMPRAAEPAAVGAAFAERGFPVRTAPDVARALDEALAEATGADLVLITGSLYLVAEARAWLLGILPDPTV